MTRRRMPDDRGAAAHICRNGPIQKDCIPPEKHPARTRKVNKASSPYTAHTVTPAVDRTSRQMLRDFIKNKSKSPGGDPASDQVQDFVQMQSFAVSSPLQLRRTASIDTSISRGIMDDAILPPSSKRPATDSEEGDQEISVPPNTEERERNPTERDYQSRRVDNRSEARMAVAPADEEGRKSLSRKDPEPRMWRDNDWIATEKYDDFRYPYHQACQAWNSVPPDNQFSAAGHNCNKTWYQPENNVTFRNNATLDPSFAENVFASLPVQTNKKKPVEVNLKVDLTEACNLLKRLNAFNQMVPVPKQGSSDQLFAMEPVPAPALQPKQRTARSLDREGGNTRALAFVAFMFIALLSVWYTTVMTEKNAKLSFQEQMEFKEWLKSEEDSEAASEDQQRESLMSEVQRRTIGWFM